jgi:shikimate 5-dehydrogenase
MHNLLFAMRGLSAVYSAFPTTSIGDVSNVIETMPEFAGASVTIPLKERVYEYLMECGNACISGEAQLAGAVNTVTRMSNGMLRGDNTDILAIRKIVDMYPGDVVIIGTGGAARAAIVAAKTLQRTIQLFGRDTAKVTELCGEFEIVEWMVDDSQKISSGRILISCIPSSGQEEIISQYPSLFSPLDRLVEMAYVPRDTPFSRMTESVTYGWEILVEQGICEHELWLAENPVDPQIVPNYEYVRKQVDFISSRHLTK